MFLSAGCIEVVTEVIFMNILYFYQSATSRYFTHHWVFNRGSSEVPLPRIYLHLHPNRDAKSELLSLDSSRLQVFHLSLSLFSGLQDETECLSHNCGDLHCDWGKNTTWRNAWTILTRFSGLWTYMMHWQEYERPSLRYTMRCLTPTFTFTLLLWKQINTDW